MKYKVLASDPIYGRMLELEFERAGLEKALENSEDYVILAAEGMVELPRARRLKAAVLIDCGLLAASLRESVKVLLLDRPFDLSELRKFTDEFVTSDEPCENKEPITLYPDDMTIFYKEESVKLTKREFELFRYLYEHSGITMSRAEILHDLWKDENARDTNVVDVYIRFLRTKLDERFGVRFIRAVRGEGYVYLPDSINDENGTDDSSNT